MKFHALALALALPRASRSAATLKTSGACDRPLTKEECRAAAIELGSEWNANPINEAIADKPFDHVPGGCFAKEHAPSGGLVRVRFNDHKAPGTGCGVPPTRGGKFRKMCVCGDDASAPDADAPPVCVKIYISEDRSGGSLGVRVDTGSGYAVAVPERHFGNRSVALDQCYPRLVGVQLSNTGRIEFSTDGGATYSAGFCAEGCVGDRHSSRVNVRSGDLSWFPDPVLCLHRQRCTFLPPAPASDPTAGPTPSPTTSPTPKPTIAATANPATPVPTAAALDPTCGYYPRYPEGRCVCEIRCPSGYSRYGDGSACVNGGSRCDLGICHGNPNSVPTCSTAQEYLDRLRTPPPTPSPTTSPTPKPTMAPASLVNLALNRPATHSSTYCVSYQPTNCDHAFKAVDGNTHGNFWAGSVEQTNYGTDPWWKVELDEASLIREVKIYRRTNSNRHAMPNLSVQLLDDAGSIIATKNPPIQDVMAVDFTDVARAASAVRLQILGGGQVMALAEVEVFGRGPAPTPTIVPTATANPTAVASLPCKAEFSGDYVAEAEEGAITIDAEANGGIGYPSIKMTVPSGCALAGTLHLWGAGGGGSRRVSGQSGGGGGYSTGMYVFRAGTYFIQVGGAGEGALESPHVNDAYKAFSTGGGKTMTRASNYFDGSGGGG